MKILKNIKISIGFLILLQLIGCNKINWQEHYNYDSKDPFGLYIFYNEVATLAGDKEEVHYLKKNINEYLNYGYTNKDFGTYVCIGDSAPKLSEEGIENLLASVFEGNNAFLSLNFFSYNLRNTLGFDTEYLYEESNDSIPTTTERKFYLKNNNFTEQPYNFHRNVNMNYFSEYNSNTTTVLGSHEINEEKRANFLKIYHGKGAVYLHINPIAFTNYYLLKDRDNYIENVFSYIPDSSIIWDPQIISSKSAPKGKNREKTIFSYFLEHKTLTWFLFVSLFGLLTFLLFNARRKQRAIPIIKPLENTTVAFTQTIASLYLKEGNHKNLVDKKINFFLEKVRTKYLIDTNNLNAKFIEKLAAKSGNDLQKTKYLINSIIDLNKKGNCTEEQLIVLHRMIDKFFKKTA